MECAYHGNGAQKESVEHCAAVAHEDGSGRQVLNKETTHSSCEDHQQDAHHKVGFKRLHAQEKGGCCDDGNAAAQSVHVVQQIHTVYNQHHPEDSVNSRSVGVIQNKQVDSQAKGCEYACNENLADEFTPRRQHMQVVYDAQHEYQHPCQQNAGKFDAAVFA